MYGIKFDKKLSLLFKIKLIINKTKKQSKKQMNQMNRMHSYDQIKLIGSDMKKSTSVQQFGNSIGGMDNLIGIIKCAICIGQVKQAHMCPTCCKLFCQMCIKNYIVYKKAQCPCCSKPLRYTSPINCQGLAKQIQNAITKTVAQMNSDIKSETPYQSKAFSSAYSTPDLNSQSSRISYVNNMNICPQHELKMQYYCQTCLIGVCSDCAVLGNNHKGHKLCKYSQKKFKFQQKMAYFITAITNAKTEFAKSKQLQTQRIQNSNRFERQKKQILLSYLKKTSDAAFLKINQAIQSKSQLLKKQQQETEQLNNLFKKYQKDLDTNKKIELIKNSEIYKTQVHNIINYKLKITKNIKLGIENELVPNFGSKTFILDNYSYLKQKGQILYSQPLFWKGIQWRLRIFPGGSPQQAFSPQSQKFLAIYLQMSKGHHEPNLYKYQILLINQFDRTKAIGCIFQNQFEQGTYWGLDRFANISFLFNQKFIHPIHGYLQIVLNVKSPTYYNIVKDQNYFIKQKQLILKKRNKYLKELRKKVGEKAINTFKGNRLSLIVKALVQNLDKLKKKTKRTMSNPKF